MNYLKETDPFLYSLITKELMRQDTELNLIASENYTWPEILQASGSVLTNKYAEGYPGKRYYAGCSVIDQVEQLAIERAKQLFNAEHVNVQPHAGCQANMAVYFAALKPGDTIMGMSLSMGGHLTHGHSVNFSGILFNAVSYGVDQETEQLDYNVIEQFAHQHKPKLIIAGASAYSRVIDFAHFAAIAKSCGAYFMADIAHITGLVAAHLHPSPVPYADFVTSTTHKTLRGPRGGLIMCKKEYADIIDRAIIPGTQGGPFMHIIAAKAAAFGKALTQPFIDYQKQIIINAKALATCLQEKGYRIVSGGTDNHLFIIDLRSKNITGKAAETALEKAGITTSRSCIPFDPEKPWITSGIRFGTPALTARGMGTTQMHHVTELVDTVLTNLEHAPTLVKVRQEVQRLCELYPIYQTEIPAATKTHHNQLYV